MSTLFKLLINIIITEIYKIIYLHFSHNGLTLLCSGVLTVPKLIFEIVSKSTASNDYITKLAVYQKYGVQEYNIVEQDGKIIQYFLEDIQYRIANVFKNDDDYTSCVFSDLKISLNDIFRG